MADDQMQRAPQDRNRINMKEPSEVQYWTKTLSCTPDELRRAIDAVGNSTEQVKKQLAKKI